MPAAIAIPAIASVIGGGVAAGAAVHGSNVASRNNQLALKATADAAAKAEAFTREEDAKNRADAAARDAEAKRQFDINQQNALHQQQVQDKQLADEMAIRNATLAQQNYKGQNRYNALLSLSKLAGIDAPPAFQPMAIPANWDPNSVGGPTPVDLSIPKQGVSSGLIASRPSSAQAMIQQPGAWSPFTSQAPIPMKRLYSAGSY